MRILIVEDDRQMAALLKRGMELESYAVDVAYDGEEGQQLAESTAYDLIILDVVLPRKNGVELCRSLRQKRIASRILMLTQKGTLPDRVKGLDAGADDYLPKPFAFEEVSARVRALLRRDVAGATVLTAGDIILDTVTRRVTVRGDEVSLRPREFAILHYLMAHAGGVVTRSMIEEHVWDMSLEAGSHLLDVYIARIRKKLGRQSDMIETVKGVGYRILSPEERTTKYDAGSAEGDTLP